MAHGHPTTWVQLMRCILCATPIAVAAIGASGQGHTVSDLASGEGESPAQELPQPLAPPRKAGTGSPPADRAQVSRTTQPSLESVQVGPPTGSVWQVEILQSDKPSYRDPAVLAPIVSLIIAFFGWIVAFLVLGRQITEQRTQLNTQLENERRNLDEQLRAERAKFHLEREEDQARQQSKQSAIENARERARIIRDKLNRFFRPYKQRSDTNKLLRQILGHGKPPGFRTLIALLEDRDILRMMRLLSRRSSRSAKSSRAFWQKSRDTSTTLNFGGYSRRLVNTSEC